jgi:SAM-dependent methyltransferase
MKKKAIRKDIFEVIEGYYISQILIYLNQAGYFLPGKNKKNKLPANNLNNLLQVLYERTDIIQKNRAGGFAVAEKYSAYTGLGFHIEKLLQAYGHVNIAGKGFGLITDETAFAQAYKNVYPYQDWKFLLDVISTMPVKHLLDLGCGAGALTVQFCKQGKNHTAVGIDSGPEMGSTARHFIKQAKLSSRIKIHCEQAENFASVLPATVIQQIDIIVAGNLFNEFFKYEGTAAVRLLKQLKQYFPGRYLIMVDYYGILGTASYNDAGLTHNYVHDMLQLFSGQGVPPSNYKKWQQLYKAAGCTLVEVTEGQSQGVKWFLHKLLL